jgi:hypothetical protein
MVCMFHCIGGDSPDHRARRTLDRCCCALVDGSLALMQLNARPASRPSQVTKGSGPACLTATCSSSSNNPVRRVAPCHRFRLMFAMFPGAAHKLRHGRKTASPHNCLGLRNCRGSIAAARQTRLNAHNETGSPSSINSKVTMHRPLRGSALVLV